MEQPGNPVIVGYGGTGGETVPVSANAGGSVDQMYVVTGALVAPRRCRPSRWKTARFGIHPIGTAGRPVRPTATQLAAVGPDGTSMSSHMKAVGGIGGRGSLQPVDGHSSLVLPRQRGQRHDAADVGPDGVVSTRPTSPSSWPSIRDAVAERAVPDGTMDIIRRSAASRPWASRAASHVRRVGFVKHQHVGAIALDRRSAVGCFYPEPPRLSVHHPGSRRTGATVKVDDDLAGARATRTANVRHRDRGSEHPRRSRRRRRRGPGRLCPVRGVQTGPWRKVLLQAANVGPRHGRQRRSSGLRRFRLTSPGVRDGSSEERRPDQFWRRSHSICARAGAGDGIRAAAVAEPNWNIIKPSTTGVRARR